MKLSEIKGERALDVLADIIEPAAEIFSDAEVKKLYEKSQMSAIAYAIRNHKKSVIAILAALDGVNAEEYECNLLTIPVKILEILNDKELVTLFT